MNKKDLCNFNYKNFFIVFYLFLIIFIVYSCLIICKNSVLLTSKFFATFTSYYLLFISLCLTIIKLFILKNLLFVFRRNLIAICFVCAVQSARIKTLNISMSEFQERANVNIVKNKNISVVV